MVADNAKEAFMAVGTDAAIERRTHTPLSWVLSRQAFWVFLAAVIAWSGVGTFLILMVCKSTTGLRVAKDAEIEGLDYTQHGETIHQ